MVKFFPRFSKKETGQISVKDGKWKMEVKERFRLIGIVTAAFSAVIVLLLIFFPYLVAAVVLIYAMTIGFLSGTLDAIQWTGRKIRSGIGWTVQWGIKQPFLDFRYGRKKRKELEATKVYGK